MKNQIIGNIILTICLVYVFWSHLQLIDSNEMNQSEFKQCRTELNQIKQQTFIYEPEVLI